MSRKHPLWVEYVNKVCYNGTYYTSIYYIFFRKIYYNVNILYGNITLTKEII